MEGRRQDQEDGRQVGFRRHKKIRFVTDRGGAGSKICLGRTDLSIISLWPASCPVFIASILQHNCPETRWDHAHPSPVWRCCSCWVC